MTHQAASSPGRAARTAGRDRQKRRTHAAILAAAARLLAAGREPSVADAADAADVSRRTAYRYIPTQDQLLVEASLEALRPTVEAALAAALPDGSGAGDDIAQAAARLDAAARIMHRQALKHEVLLRTMIRLTTGQVGSARPRRGYRRVDWLTSAVEPVRQRLGPRRFDRLVSALASCVGMDALFVLQDIRSLSARAAEQVTRWTARALLDASVADGPGEPVARDEAEIRQLIDAQVAAWNRGDAAGYAEACLPEVGFTNILGMRWDTRDGHVGRHAEMFRGAFAGSRLAMEIERLLPIGPDVVLAELLTTLTGFRALPPGISAARGGALRTRMLEVFVRRGGRWWIASCHNTAVGSEAQQSGGG